jgi:hypothetical protein
LSTYRQPRLRLVRLYDPQAERATSDWEYYAVYKAAKVLQWLAEKAGWTDQARAARGIADFALSQQCDLRRRP